MLYYLWISSTISEKLCLRATGGFGCDNKRAFSGISITGNLIHQ